MIPFSPPKIYPEIIEEVSEALRSGWITTGPRTKQLEKELTAFCGNKATLCLNSATAGMELMLRWFGVSTGDEVIVPVYTYCATANVVLHCGATPIFVDVNPDDFNINIEKVAAAITEKTKIIMPVDFAGFPCNYEALNDLVQQPEIKRLFSAKNEIQQKLGRILILADAAHSFGGSIKGNKTGALTDAGVFSFHAVKNLTTAEGGAIALNLPAPFDNEEIYRYLCTFSLHGQSKDALAKSKGGSWQYDVETAGFKCNMTDIQAAMGLVELRHYENETLKRRKTIFEAYANAFKQYDWAQIPVFETATHTSSFHVFALRIKNINEAQRNKIIEKITEKEVSVNVHFQPLPMLAVYKNLGYKMSDYPVAFDNYSREISLPVYFDLSDENIKTVVKAVVETVEGIRK